MAKKTKAQGVSLVISTYNWKEALELVLLSVFNQTVLPDELIIADDGSRPDTQALIDRYRQESPIPIEHVWQEDKGFRLSKIRNKAIATAKKDYIIQIDGDCVLEQHFIQDHIEAARPGTYVCGSRACCSQEFTQECFKSRYFDRNKFKPVKGSFFNQFRIKLLRNSLMKYFPITIKGCNMAFWKKDVLTVNGYDEDYEGWGYEDHDLAIRFDNIGLKKRSLKMGAVMYHLYHREKDGDLSSEDYKKRMQKMAYLRENKVIRISTGIDQY